MTNYFLLYRPFHFSYCTLIIEKFFKNETNVLISHFAGTQIQAGANGIIPVAIGKGSLKDIAEMRRWVRTMIKTAKSGETVNVFIPHSLGILSNFAYNQLARKYKNVHIHIFYEGIIVFYNYEHPFWKNFGYYVSRSLMGALCGIRYHVESRLLDLYDPRIENIYSPFLNLKAPAEKLIKVELKKVEYLPLFDTCVILGLDLGPDLKEDMKRIITEMYNKAMSLGIKKVYFKQHPSEKNLLFDSIAEKMGITLHPINNSRPIEEIVGEYKPGFVFSIWSSAMANLTSVVPETVRIISFVTSNLSQNTEHKKILDRFEEMEIEVIIA